LEGEVTSTGSLASILKAAIVSSALVMGLVFGFVLGSIAYNFQAESSDSDLALQQKQ
jgi:hypothetical protein